MSLSLNNLQGPKNNRTKRRVGRGAGSGRGTYAGRGMKGQRARSGGKSGLQKRALKSVILRLPKHSHLQPVSAKPAIVNLTVLSKTFSAGSIVTPKVLVKHGLVEAGVPVKILATGTMAHAITLKGCKVSESAVAKIVAAGGKVE